LDLATHRKPHPEGQEVCAQTLIPVSLWIVSLVLFSWWFLFLVFEMVLELIEALIPEARVLMYPYRNLTKRFSSK
jgi:hypothetical protein